MLLVLILLLAPNPFTLRKKRTRLSHYAHVKQLLFNNSLHGRGAIARPTQLHKGVAPHTHQHEQGQENPLPLLM